MTTVAESPTSRKPATAFYAFLGETHGVLTRVHGEVLFLSDAGDITPVASTDGLLVLGEVGLADTQRLMDEIHGGLVATVCTPTWRLSREL